MLTSSSSPGISAASSRYSASNLAHFTNKNSASKSRKASSPRELPKTPRRQSSSLSPSVGKSHPPAGFRSPKRPTCDAATQYTPPGLPPTSRLPDKLEIEPSIRTQISGDTDTTVSQTATLAYEAPSEPPPEPSVRESPQPVSTHKEDEQPAEISPSVPGHGRRNIKRQRQEGGDVNVVPSDYSLCEPKVLATLIAALLMDLIGHNDKIKLEDGNLTRFHSRTPPAISVHDYLHRLTYHGTLPSPVLLAMVNYIDKLCEAFPIFTINSLTVHRFLIAAATVAAKGLCDVFWTNSTYAKVGGVSKKELALLELELLTKIEWRIVPDPDKLGDYYKNVVENHPDYALDESDSSAASSESIGTDTMETD